MGGLHGLHAVGVYGSRAITHMRGSAPDARTRARSPRPPDRHIRPPVGTPCAPSVIYFTAVGLSVTRARNTVTQERVLGPHTSNDS